MFKANLSSLVYRPYNLLVKAAVSVQDSLLYDNTDSTGTVRIPTLVALGILGGTEGLRLVGNGPSSCSPCCEILFERAYAK